MNKSDLAVGDRVVISAVFFDRHRPLIGEIGTVQRVFKTRDEVKLILDDGWSWNATPCNLSPIANEGIEP